MSWSSPPTRATGDLVTAAQYNTVTVTNINHLHEGLHMLSSALSYVSGNIWQAGNNFLSGKVISLIWNFVPIPNTVSANYFSATTLSQITFTTVMTSALNGGTATSGADSVIMTYLISE